MGMTVQATRLRITYPQEHEVVKGFGLSAQGKVFGNTKGTIAGVIISDKGEVFPGILLAGPPRWRIMFYQGPDGLPSGHYLLVVTYWLKEKPLVATRRFKLKSKSGNVEDSNAIKILSPVNYDDDGDNSVCPNFTVGGYAPSSCTTVNVICTATDLKGVGATASQTQTVTPQGLIWTATFNSTGPGDYDVVAEDANNQTDQDEVPDVNVIDCGGTRPAKKRIKKR
jgi:hypothetical protein